MKCCERDSLRPQVAKSKQRVFLGFQVLLQQPLGVPFRGLAETEQSHFTTSPCKKACELQRPAFILFLLFRFK